MANARADRMLCCAVAYRNANVKDAPMRAKYSNEKEAIGAMMNALWFEAKASMSEAICQPEDAYMHPVDIDTSEPGIVTSKNKAAEIMRRRVPLPRVVYERREPIAYKHVEVAPTRTFHDAQTEAAKMEQKERTQAQRRARRDLKAENRSVEKMEEMEERKRKRAEETPQAREERLVEQRAKRAEKKRLREEQAQAVDDPDKTETSDTAEAKATRKDAPAESPKSEDIALHVQELLEAESDADKAHHALLPQRVRARSKKARFFPSPVPFDRHLCALEQTLLHKNLRDAVLKGSPSSHLKIVQGPPGTGKTKFLASSQLAVFATERIFMCAPTNVGTANLYARVLETEPAAALLMPASRIPPGTPVTSQDPGARIVCSTISGRAGPLLDSQKFGVVMVDEAAQCMEAWLWCLLRPEVHTLVMVGDTKQLPALVSADGQALGHGQSMMDRLVSLGYPAEFLNVQRRMHPEIVHFPNNRFYQGRLQTDYDATHACPPYQIVNVDADCTAIGTSYVNRDEIAVCLVLVRELEALFERVVVISPYQAQTRELLASGVVHVHTIDSFQGQEADAVIISVVRNEEIGFWSDHRRLNVALTRARSCLRVVGSSARWSGVLRELADDAQARGVCITSTG